MIEKQQLDEPESRRPKWIWRSHPGTTDEGIISVLAIAEVLLAVAAYWSFALWAHTQVHLLIGIIVAPFLLLRSEKSIELGLKWFASFDIPGPFFLWTEEVDEKIYARLEGSGFRALFAFFLSRSTFMFFLIVTILATLVIRVSATARYLLPGIVCLSDNWWRTLFATDIFSRSEIVPGHANRESYINFENLTDFILENRAETETVRLGAVFTYLMFLGPSYVYRMSIKSTAWVHWPLAYISRPLRYADDPEEVRMRLWTDPREWLRRVFMVVTLAGALVASIPSLATLKTAFPAGVVSIAEYAIFIDVKTLFRYPWRVAALISAAITLFLTWYGFELSLLVKRATVKPDRLARAASWAAALEYTMRVRDICGWFFWALVFVHAGLWLIPSTSWLKGYPQEILQFIYGDYLPPGLA